MQSDSDDLAPREPDGGIVDVGDPLGAKPTPVRGEKKKSSLTSGATPVKFKNAAAAKKSADKMKNSRDRARGTRAEMASREKRAGSRVRALQTANYHYWESGSRVLQGLDEVEICGSTSSSSKCMTGSPSRSRLDLGASSSSPIASSEHIESRAAWWTRQLLTSSPKSKTKSRSVVLDVVPAEEQDAEHTPATVRNDKSSGAIVGFSTPGTRSTTAGSSVVVKTPYTNSGKRGPAKEPGMALTLAYTKRLVYSILKKQPRTLVNEHKKLNKLEPGEPAWGISVPDATVRLLRQLTEAYVANQVYAGRAMRERVKKGAMLGDKITGSETASGFMLDRIRSSPQDEGAEEDKGDAPPLTTDEQKWVDKHAPDDDKHFEEKIEGKELVEIFENVIRESSLGDTLPLPRFSDGKDPKKKREA